MTRGKRSHGALPPLLCALLLVGCTGSGSGSDAPDSAPTTPPPTLEAQWTIAGLNANPERTGERHWMTYQEFTSGMGRGMTSATGPTLLVDARTGATRRPSVEPERFPCLTPSLISDDGIVPVFWSTYARDPSGSWRTESCTRITVLDADSGKTLWRRDALDLTGLAPERAVGADERTIVVVDSRGRSRCFAARTGARRGADKPPCVALRDRLTHADLPELVDGDGEPQPLTPPWAHESDPDATEIGRTDEVLLVRARNEVIEGGMIQERRSTVRAHDLETGETLWQDDELTPDPHQDDAWTRTETYFVAPSGVVRVSYEHPDDADLSAETPMVLTAVDPRTGEDLKPIARVEGAWFNHQFGNVTVALTHQERGLKSRISGFELPTW